MTRSRFDLDTQPGQNLEMLLIERDVTALYHFAQGKQWLDIVRNKDENIPLSYCAFEFESLLKESPSNYLRKYEELHLMRLTRKHQKNLKTFIIEFIT